MKMTEPTARPFAPYEPEAGSMQARVLALFVKNAEEEYTSSDLALKFQLRADRFTAALATPVKHGLLVYMRSHAEEPKTWRAGPNLHAWAGARDAQALLAARGLAGEPEPKANGGKPSKRGGSRVRLPAIDPATLVTELNVPTPPEQRFSRSGVSKYDAVFKDLPVNACRRVPAVYHATLVTAIKKRHKAGLERYVVRRVSPTESGVFRTA